MTAVPGTEGYERSIQRFIESSQALDFAEVCQDFLDHLPLPPGRVLDAGAGAGQNAAAIAKMGHSVVAIEPMPDFLAAARATYADLPVTWLDDSLPRLQRLGSVPAQFDFILVDGVWHHLDESERSLAIAHFAFLLKPGGKCALSLRHGPAGLGTCVYPTDANRTLEEARTCGLECALLRENQPSLFSHKKDVTWSRLVLLKPTSTPDADRDGGKSNQLE